MAPKDDLRINLSTDRLSRIKCMECGHKNPGDVEFCTKCRAKMVLECADCGFKSPQGSEFCGSCGNETESGIKDRENREREEARAAALATPKTIVQKVRHGIAKVFYFLGTLWVVLPVTAVVLNRFDPFMWWEVVGVGVAGGVFFGLVGLAIDPPIYRDHY